MKTFHAEIDIAGTADVVWEVLTDAARYPDWNSTVERVDGQIVSVERVTVHAKVSPGRAFPLVVGNWDPPRRMTWKGGMPLGLFSGVRTLSVKPVAEGRVTFVMREEYSGLLAGLITRSIPDLQPAFDRFAADLKARVERPSR